MIPSLLVITSQPSFGEHIRQSLEETSPAHVEIVGDEIAALYKLQEEKFTHAFLDTDIKNGSILDIGLALRQKDPDLNLVIVSAKQSIPRFDGLRPWNFLSKPFFITDLLRVLSPDSIPALPLSRKQESHRFVKENPVDKKETLTWLEDVNIAAQRLTSLTLESSAQAALIIRDREVWASVGQLSSRATSEIAQTVLRDKKKGDLLKFLRLNATQAEHMLYATELANDAGLAMVFDAETPFSAIRKQAANLAESLTVSLHSSPELTPSLGESTTEKGADEEVTGSYEFDDEELKDLLVFSEILDDVPDPTPTTPLPEVKNAEPISPSVPNVSRKSISAKPMPKPFAKSRFATAMENVTRTTSKEASPSIRAGDYFGNNQQVDHGLAETRVQEVVQKPMQSISLAFEETRLSSSIRPKTPIYVPSHDELIGTRPHSITEVAGRVIIEPSSTYELTYACLLVPRFSSHHLTGDLSERLSEWMPNICVAFNWRLEHLAVRPDYLQWVVKVPPTTSPGYLMRIIRKQTSGRIFNTFPQKKNENPSGDFWAPGYLILGGGQPHPSKLVEDYIMRTRKRQGTWGAKV